MRPFLSILRDGWTRLRFGSGFRTVKPGSIELVNQLWLSPREVLRVVRIEDEGKVYKLAHSSGGNSPGMLLLSVEAVNSEPEKLTCPL